MSIERVTLSGRAAQSLEHMQTAQGLDAFDGEARRSGSRAPAGQRPVTIELCGDSNASDSFFTGHMALLVADGLHVGGICSASSGATYIGAFPLLDASDFASALASVGRKVELIGKVVSVKEGVGKRGIGKGKPYVFVNFGDWLGESVRLTILRACPNYRWNPITQNPITHGSEGGFRLRA